MSSVSIICLRRDVDNVLEVLSGFGEFHIEHAADADAAGDYNQRIQKVEGVLADVNDLAKTLETEKTGLTDMFRAEKPAKTTVTAENWQALADAVTADVAKLKREAQDLKASAASLKESKAELSHIRDMLAVMENMEVDLQAMEELHSISIVVASVPAKDLPDLDKALEGLPVIFHRCYLAKETQFVCSAFPAKHRQDMERLLKTHHGEIFTIPPNLPHDVSQALAEVEKQLAEISQKEKENEAALHKMAESNRARLVSLRETTQNILALLQAEKKVLQSGRIATVTGFVPKQRFGKLTEAVTAGMEGTVVVLENDVEPAADPPTMIRNSRFVKPFEEITRLYGVPHYDELDPTPIIAVTFPLLFGLMFGDVGHGLVLLTGGLALGFLIKKQSAIKNIAWIMAACGVGAIFAGLLFGEFFGTQLFAPLWFSPFDNVLTFLIFSLFVGVAQIISGLAMEMVDFVLRRNVLDALLTSVPKIAFYVGSVYLIAAYQLNFGAWLAGPILFALIPFLVLVFGRTLILRAAAQFSRGSTKVPQERMSLGERFFESSDLVARLMSNTMSYARILALLMAHWALILVVYVIAGLVGTASPLSLVISGIVVIGGNVFVIALEGLIVFIHALRLHFYEWFSKFYGGNGTPFSPFKQNFVYTDLQFKNKKKPPEA